MLGMPNSVRGIGPSVLVSKCPSMAATLAGWCSSVLMPWKSPATIWIGATTVAIQSAIENMTLALALRLSRNRWKAPTPPTMNAVVR